MVQMKEKMAETTQGSGTKWNLDGEIDKLMVMLKQEYVRLSDEQNNETPSDMDIMDDTSSFLRNELHTQTVSPNWKYELTVPGGLKEKKTKKRAQPSSSNKKRRSKADRERRG